MKKKVFTISLIIIILILSTLTIFLLTKKDKSEERSTLGVWWWDNRIDDSYLDFAKNNDVTEIYYYASNFNEKIETFIQKANAKDIDVYWLTGKYEWIEDNLLLEEKMELFLEFQNNSPYKFKGIHFDIEPRQHPEFDVRREELITKFINLADNVRTIYPNIFIEYDLPCWLEDEVTYKNNTKPAFAHIFDYSNRITFMSYRDNAEKILDFAKEEIDYATINNKRFNLSVETQNVGDNIVTFYEEGKKYLFDELNKLKQQLGKNNGIAIHHIISWRELKD